MLRFVFIVTVSTAPKEKPVDASKMSKNKKKKLKKKAKKQQQLMDLQMQQITEVENEKVTPILKQCQMIYLKEVSTVTS